MYLSAFYFVSLVLAINILPRLLVWMLNREVSGERLWWEKKTKKPIKNQSYWLYLAQLILFSTVFIALARAGIQGISDGFVNIALHFFGGGVVGSFVYTYVYRSLGLRLGLVVNFIIFFFFLSGLGVLNEIYEYWIDIFIIQRITESSDAVKDLVVNTLGGFSGLLVIEIFTYFNQSSSLEDEKVNSKI